MFVCKDAMAGLLRFFGVQHLQKAVGNKYVLTGMERANDCHGWIQLQNKA